MEQDRAGPLTASVAHAVRSLREQRGWSARELEGRCAEAGLPSLTRSTIAKIESGVRPFVTVDEVAVLAQVFDLAPEDLIQLARGIAPGRRRPTAVIITALAVEFDAVHRRLTDTTEVVHPSGTIYQRGEFGSWDVVVAQAGGGSTGAAVETSRALDFFRPSMALLVGVAAGVRQVEIGDVVVAEHVYSFESGKVSDGAVQPRIKSFGPSHALVQAARAVARSDRWHKDVSGGAAPHCVVGSVVSMAQTFPTAEGLAAVRAVGRDVVAIEMEGAGFMFASHTSGDPHALVVRGISDLAEAGKAGDWRRAAENAAAFAFELLTYRAR